jgi:hypothetical protein
VDFISRDLQTRRLLSDIIDGSHTDAESLRRIFAWTIRNMRPMPMGFPVIDDHVWSIIVRRYGTDDQRTEVFAMLASYACCPAASAQLRPDTTKELVVAVTLLDGQPRVFDVVNGLMFRNRAGQFATVDDLVRDPALVTAASRGLAPDGVRYERYAALLADVHPVYARMEGQKPWPRLMREIARAFGGV